MTIKQPLIEEVFQSPTVEQTASGRVKTGIPSLSISRVKRPGTAGSMSRSPSGRTSLGGRRFRIRSRVSIRVIVRVMECNSFVYKVGMMLNPDPPIPIRWAHV